MVLKVYENRSGYNVLNKNLYLLKTIDTAEFILPVDLVDPVLYLKPDSKVVEGQYIEFDNPQAFYQITRVVTEHNRLKVVCHIDVLSSFMAEILNLDNVTLERTSYDKKLGNFFLEDNEIDILSYPFEETHYLTAISGTTFSNKKNEFILGITGGVTNT